MGYKVPKFAKSNEIHAEWWSFRHCDPRREISFIHSAALVDTDGNVIVKANVGYCNRTWECHSGDTVRSRLAELIKTKHKHLLNDPKVAKIVAELEKSQEWDSYSSDYGTRIGYSLSMCCPM